MFLFLFCQFCSFVFAEGDDCVPFAARLQLGDYYSDQNDEKIIIFFNTHQPCPEAHLKLNYKRIPVESTQSYDFDQSEEGDESSDDQGISQNPFKLFNKKIDKMVDENQDNRQIHVTYIHKVVLKDVVPGKNYKYALYGFDDGSNSTITKQFRVPYREVKEATRLVITGNLEPLKYSKPTFEWFEALKVFRTNIDGIIYMGPIKRRDTYYEQVEDFLKNFSNIAGIWPLMIMPYIYEDEFFFDRHFSYSEFINYYDLGFVRVYSLDIVKFLYTEMENKYEYLFVKLLRDLPPQIKWKVLLTNIPQKCFTKHDILCLSYKALLEDFQVIYEIFDFHLVIESYYPLYARSHADTGQKNTYIYDQKPVFIANGVGGYDDDNGYNDKDRVYQGTQKVYYGHSVGVLTASNDTHLHYQQVSTTNNVVVDEVFIIQPKITPKQTTFFALLILTMIFMIGLGIIIIKRFGLCSLFVQKSSISDQFVSQNEMQQNGKI